VDAGALAADDAPVLDLTDRSDFRYTVAHGIVDAYELDIILFNVKALQDRSDDLFPGHVAGLPSRKLEPAAFRIRKTNAVVPWSMPMNTMRTFHMQLR